MFLVNRIQGNFKISLKLTLFAVNSYNSIAQYTDLICIENSGKTLVNA